MITELDHFGIAKNLVDLVGRRKEGYHDKLLHRHESTGAAATKSIHDLVLVKEEGLENLLLEDTYRRGMFVDHIFGDSATRNDFECGKLVSMIGHCQHPYADSAESSVDSAFVKLTRTNRVASTQGSADIEIVKTLKFAPKPVGVVAQYELRNRGNQNLAFTFGCEIGLGSYPFPNTESFLVGSFGERLDLNSGHELINSRDIAIYSRLYRFLLRLSSNRDATIWTHPLWTVSLSEGGFEKVLQGTIILLRWSIALAPGEVWATEIGLETHMKIEEAAISGRQSTPSS